MVAYEYMAVVTLVYIVEFGWELKLVWPHLKPGGKGLGVYNRLVAYVLMSTVFGLPHVILEGIADFPQNRILGEAGMPPITYVSTETDKNVTVEAYQGFCVGGWLPLFDFSLVFSGVELGLYEYMALFSLFALLTEEMQAAKRPFNACALRTRKILNTALAALITAAYVVTSCLWNTRIPAYFLCEKVLETIHPTNHRSLSILHHSGSRAENNEHSK